jgi:hypothetical protein
VCVCEERGRRREEKRRKKTESVCEEKGRREEKRREEKEKEKGVVAERCVADTTRTSAAWSGRRRRAPRESRARTCDANEKQKLF